MINTNLFSMFVARGGGDDVGIVHGQCDAVGKVAVFEKGPRPNQPSRGKKFDQSVREVFIIHVGGTRCVTSSTDNIMKIHARITLTVEFIRGCIFIFLCVNTISSMITTNFFSI